MAEVLAKSSPPISLRQHTDECLGVFRSVRLLFPHLPQICGVPAFFEHLFYSVYLHDIGKTASGFQAMLRGEIKRWEYRHEVLSAGFISSLDSLEEDTKRAIVMAVITHHKGIGVLKERCRTTSTTGREHYEQRLQELTENFEYAQQFLQQLPQYAQEYLGYKLPAPTLPNSITDLVDGYKYAVVWYEGLKENEPKQIHSTYGTLLRGLMIACDHLASSGREEVKAGLSKNFIDQVLLFTRAVEMAKQQPSQCLFSALDVESVPTKEMFARQSLYPYQRQMMSVEGHAFLSAPTGSGKTEASLLWAGANQDSGRRIFYVLPYTASINAMSKRLTNLFGEDNVGVLHGKAGYFIYTMMCERDYTPTEAAAFARDIQGLTKKLYRPLKILTPFQILKAFFGVKGWESMLAEMAGGLFIFDEIHVYDAHTTALILKSIERLAKLDAKFLFLSATFPNFLKQKIRTILPSIRDIELDETEPADNRLMNSPRHRVELLPGEISEHLTDIQDDLAQGKRVLVVCNTVRRAQEIYPDLKDSARSSAMLHGRFILRDRERIEKSLDQVQLLVGTQAIEVSLDLDFDILFTEPAAIDALIQRFGRVNRRRQKGVAPVRICRIGSPYDKYFYDPERIATTLTAFQNGEALTEKRVAELVEQVYQNGYNAEEQATFDGVSNAFSDVVARLYPFDESEDKDLFYNLIKSVEVIPSRAIEDLYREARENKQHFEAIRYYCNLTLGQKAKLRNEVRIEPRTDNQGDFYWFVDARYDEELGLLINEKEIGAGIID